MNNKIRGKTIRNKILQDVNTHSRDLTKHISKIFSITPQAVYNHINKLTKSGHLATKGSGKGKSYFLGDIRENVHTYSLNSSLEENEIWNKNFSFIFEDLNENIIDICHYGFTEMVNNAIDHSGGKKLVIYVYRDIKDVFILVADDGEGIFKRIQRLCQLSDERQALLELSKGKLTTDPDNHTGEGIFFTSRIFDQFALDSKGITYSHHINNKFDFIDNSNLTSTQKEGTKVMMLIAKKSKTNIQDIFDEYAKPDDFQFNKTVIPVRLAQYGSEKLISRSQAKRLLNRVEKFENVVFDFKTVNYIGQAFADEIFRVYVKKHPNITLLPINMEDDVSKMIKRVISVTQ